MFVHGAYAGAWCWSEHFVPFFERRGHRCVAVELPGHEPGSAGPVAPTLGLADYVAAVVDTVRGLDRPAVLIGHSMGGAVAQRVAERCAVAGLALLASVPPDGLFGPAASLWMRAPVLAVELACVQAGRAELASFATLRAALFSEDLPDALAWRYLARMRAESQRALMDLSWMHLAPARPALDRPPLVLSGLRDLLFPAEVARHTARAYGVAPVLLPDLGHILMLDVAWRAAAERLAAWIEHGAQ